MRAGEVCASLGNDGTGRSRLAAGQPPGLPDHGAGTLEPYRDLLGGGRTAHAPDHPFPTGKATKARPRGRRPITTTPDLSKGHFLPGPPAPGHQRPGQHHQQGHGSRHPGSITAGRRALRGPGTDAAAPPPGSTDAKCHQNRALGHCRVCTAHRASDAPAIGQADVPPSRQRRAADRWFSAPATAAHGLPSLLLAPRAGWRHGLLLLP